VDAKEYKTSQRTVERAAAFARTVDAIAKNLVKK
jgi:hypothetical protein